MLNVNAPIRTPAPCTPRGVIELLLRNDYDLKGKHVVVVGRGVDRPPDGSAAHRRDINATVTQVHTGTPDMSPYLREADVIVAGAEVKHLIRATDVKPGGLRCSTWKVTRETDPSTGKSRVYGDVDPAVAEVAGWISPNPGGVGPMTVALLMTNVVEAAERTVSGG